ncbi:tetratricopeptide repeat protein [bacterium]|nr:tetratricopeptide repeat protein [bacterium]
MSYNLFLLLNINHEPEPLLDFIGTHLERTGPTTFCIDHSPDTFFSAEYLREGSDSSLAIDIPFGSEETALREVFDFMTELQEYIQFQLLDPQLGGLVEPNETERIYAKWKDSNVQALENFSDGHHFLRSMEVREGKKTMIEAIRFREETWQNHCSVALAYGRIHDAENARKHFQRALELDPQNASILHALGVTYFNLQEYEKAKSVLQEALDADPDNEAARELIRDCESKDLKHD